MRDLRRILRPNGTLAFYVWDYPGGGLGFLRAFWSEATSLDPAAAALAEDRRFSDCTAARLANLARRAGLAEVVCAGIEIPTVFADFEDYWRSLVRGDVAPAYCAALAPAARTWLEVRLRDRLGPGPIDLIARVRAVRDQA